MNNNSKKTKRNSQKNEKFNTNENYDTNEQITICDQDDIVLIASGLGSNPN